MPTNPYIGPRPFEIGQKLYGREAERRDLLRLLSAERIVLLHSPSGAGKTSLIQAGLLPDAQKRYTVLPIIRVNTPLDPALPPDTNRYLASTFLSLEKNQTEAAPNNMGQLARAGLAAYLAGREAGAQALAEQQGRTHARWLLVFDQFEEILTLNPNDLEAKHAFFRQLGETLEDRRIWAIFIMREDYVAALEPYRQYFPNQLATRFRLDLLGREAALTAIEAPAAEAGVNYAPGVAQQLVDDLCQVQVQQADGTVKVEPGPYVEPVQLQVVCHRLWNTLPAGATTIDAAQLAEVGSVNTALSGYYDEKLELAAQQAAYNPGLLRRWVDKQLITAAGFRSQVLQEQGAQWTQFNRAVAVLIDAYLVREEKRRGATWLELAHDRLVKPVQAANQHWYEAHPDDLPTRASLWAETGRPEGLLLNYKTLAQVEKEKTTRSAQEEEFLVASRRAVQAAKAAHQRRQWIAASAVFSALTAIVVAGLAIWAFYLKAEADTQTQIAKAQTQLANARQMIAVAGREMEDQLDKAFLLSIEAHNIGPELADSRTLLLEALQTQPRLQRFIHLPPTSIGALAFNATRNLFAAASCVNPDEAPCTQSQITLWDNTQNTALTAFAVDTTVTSLAFNPAGTVLALGGGGGHLHFWDLTTLTTPQLLSQVTTAHTATVTSLAFNPSGTVMASGSHDTKVLLWNVQQPTAVTQLSEITEHTAAVNTLTFSPSGEVLASGGNDQNIILWDVSTPTSPRQTHTLPGQATIKALAFSPDGQTLVSGDSNGQGQVWDLTGDRPQAEALPGGLGMVASVAFNPNGQVLAVAGCKESQGDPLKCPEGQVQFWDLSSHTATPGRERPHNLRATVSGHNRGILGLAFSADGNLLISGDANGQLIVWQGPLTSTSPILAKSWAAHSDATNNGINSLAFTGTLLATGSGDHTIRLWSAPTATLISTLKGHSDEVTSVAFNAAGTRLASGSVDNNAIVWEVATGQALHTLVGHQARVSSVAFNPAGNWLITGGWDAVARVWDTQSGQLLYTLAGHTAEINSLAVNPAGTLLATGSNDGTVRLWDLTGSAGPIAHGEPLTGNQFILNVLFSADGQKLFASDSDGTLHQWDISDPAAPQYQASPEQARAGRIINLALNPLDNLLATHDSQVGVYLRDLLNGAKEMGSGLLDHGSNVYSLAFSPDGAWLASGDADGNVFLWLGSPAAWRGRLCQMAGRNLTQAEWQELALDAPYHVTCAQWPSGE